MWPSQLFSEIDVVLSTHIYTLLNRLLEICSSIQPTNYTFSPSQNIYLSIYLSQHFTVWRQFPLCIQSNSPQPIALSKSLNPLKLPSFLDYLVINQGLNLLWSVQHECTLSMLKEAHGWRGIRICGCFDVSGAGQLVITASKKVFQPSNQSQQSLTEMR